ncbi:MAG: M23 family metallopeptidase [Clostridia bacterium]|nr:M23 family metallopeptidase [Clostridia bacterium]
MVLHLDKRRLAGFLSLILALFAVVLSFYTNVSAEASGQQQERDGKSYIKWAEMNFSLSALQDTMELDIETYGKLYHISWIDALSYLACKNGNSWDGYKKSQLDKMVEELGEGNTVDDLMQGNKYYTYYKESFSAMLSGLLGVYEKEAPDGMGGKKIVSGYGLIAYSPIAEGFSYSHYDDFGVSRSYGYRRSHMGNDLMGYVGTPVMSVEAGTVEAIGWNQYGGWRLGIRSLDGKRSYYYAHLRKGRPYAEGIEVGSKVKPGQVIGYLGMTGYSTKENVNGMNVPHLHFGLQLIFDESQKEGTNQIWLDVYNLVRLLSKNKATVVKDEKTGEYIRKYDITLKSIDF